ncbi:hypothetical protein RIB2604_01701880 [Aspergillus luchuensis]|uniref:Uncharacterized protein n=1 Tax=Aspergillus kawachii TaxID=1069201 RepID=A0A146FBJ2_ASPKA|nr:hypothetical protein RIB2604_01701880 [Aspergillus luchuensis]
MTWTFANNGRGRVRNPPMFSPSARKAPETRVAWGPCRSLTSLTPVLVDKSFFIITE